HQIHSDFGTRHSAMAAVTGGTVKDMAAVLPSVDTTICVAPGAVAVTTPVCETRATSGFDTTTVYPLSARRRPRPSRGAALSCSVSPGINVSDSGTTSSEATGSDERPATSPDWQLAPASIHIPIPVTRASLIMLRPA